MRMSFCLDARNISITDFGRNGAGENIRGEDRGSKLANKGSALVRCNLFVSFKEGALAARMFVGAKWSSNLPPRAQCCMGAGQSAALAGSIATLFIGHSGESLSGFVISLAARETGSMANGRDESHAVNSLELASSQSPKHFRVKFDKCHYQYISAIRNICNDM